MNAKDRIRVFISSRCGEKYEQYEIVRKALQNLIEETGIATVYVFETAPGSSQDVQSAYLNKVDDCNVFVLIVDNKDDVTPYIQSEINQAKLGNKRMLCFFCNEREKKETEVQKDIRELAKCKYKVVPLFSDLVHEIYVTLVQDIIDVYVAPKVTTPVKVVELEDTNKQKLSYISEDIFKELSSPKKEFSKHLFNKTQADSPISSELDNAFGSFLKVLLCEKKYDDDAFIQLKNMITKMFSGHMHTVMEFRLDAVRFFFMEDLNSCINSLEKVVEFINNSKSIPTWILNDVAIDLRNMIIEKGLKQNRLIPDNKGQNIINATKELVVFPTIDRIATNIFKYAIKHYNSALFESPYSVTLGGIEEIFDEIGNYFCRSLMFGSITHLRMVLLKYNEALLPLCLEYNEKTFTIEVIQKH